MFISNLPPFQRRSLGAFSRVVILCVLSLGFVSSLSAQECAQNNLPACPPDSPLCLVSLDKEVSTTLLLKAMDARRVDLMEAAIRLGADSDLLRESYNRFMYLGFLQLYEKLQEQQGKPCTYSQEDWITVLTNHDEYTISSDEARPIIKHLQSKGLDINGATSKGLPLEIAANTPSLGDKVIQVLLEAGANPMLLSAENKAKMDEILHPPCPAHARKPLPLVKENAEALLRRALWDEDEARENEAMELVRLHDRAAQIIDDAFITFAQYGSVAALNYLLKQGADIHAVGLDRKNRKRTALSLALSRPRPHPDVVAFLKDKGALFFTKDDYDQKNPDDINARSYYINDTPLMIHLQGSLCGGVYDYAPCYATEEYLRQGADPKLTNRAGQSALFECCRDSAIHNLAALILAKADVNQRDSSGRTALFGAIENGSLLASLMLLEAGADPFLIDDYGMSLLDCQANKDVFGRAQREKNVVLLKQLVKAYQASSK